MHDADGVDRMQHEALEGGARVGRLDDEDIPRLNQAAFRTRRLAEDQAGDVTREGIQRTVVGNGTFSWLVASRDASETPC